ncbi:type I methionyl aminopeptidase [Candidatus Peregrinibacteria bacterium]|nr:MAG: type I methionyl aminopeptidase [Candidatus Peregrinibacteria bacterium]
MGMTKVKTPEQIKAMRESCHILGLILKELEDMTVPGITPMDLERRAEELCAKYKVRPAFKGYHGYPYILCTSVNDQVVHAFPTEVPLQEGDILSIDGGVVVSGMVSDSAVAVVVGQKTSDLAQRLVDTCIKAMWAGIHQVKDGCRVGDIGHAIQRVVEDAGFTVITELTGHGIGENMHEAPYILNYGEPGKGTQLRAGMTIAIEPIICTGKNAIETLDDDWTLVTTDGSLAMQHEHTVLITKTGYEVLSLRPGEKEV